MTEDVNPSGMDDVTSDDKLWALLAYIFPLIAILALVMEDKKERPFLKYHAVPSPYTWHRRSDIKWCMYWVISLVLCYLSGLPGLPGPMG